MGNEKKIGGKSLETGDKYEYESKTEKSHKELLDYNPTHFLRCHSKKNDKADVQTQVWQCAFEPDINDKRKTTSVVATCGGNSVCFIDTKTGTVYLKYYAKDVRELFYALAWTMNDGHTYLVCAGIRYTVHFVHPASGICFYTKPIKGTKHKNHINSLLFHPAQWNLLICGGSHGEIHICNIGSPAPPDFEVDFTVLHCFSTNSEIFSMSFCPDNNMLLTGCDDGLTGWDFSNTDSKFSVAPESHRFTLPVRNSNASGGQDLVDSLEVVEHGLVATKCALHGAIYLWNLTDTLHSSHPHAIQPSHVLRFSSTDNYFMFLGAQSEAGLLCCGDDQGQLWLYDLRLLPTAVHDTPQAAEPSVILPWPSLTDFHTEKKRKLAVDTYDIVVDKVVLSSDRQHIVAVTNNNMVCIWEAV